MKEAPSDWVDQSVDNRQYQTYVISFFCFQITPNEILAHIKGNIYLPISINVQYCNDSHPLVGLTGNRVKKMATINTI